MNKEAILQAIRDGLASGALDQSDLRALVDEQDQPTVGVSSNSISAATHEAANGKKLSIIDMLFYLAGIVLFAALAVLAGQSGEGVSRILITLVPGLILWTLSYLYGSQPNPSEVRKGMVNAMVLTGCLAVVTGAFLAAWQVVGGSDAGSSFTYAASVALIILGVCHLLFDRLFRHIILVSLGVLLLVAAFPTLLAGILNGLNVSIDVWAAIGICTGILLGYGGRLAAMTAPGRGYLAGSFASVAAFIILANIYAASFTSSAAIIWEILLPITIYGAFFVSIKRKSKNFLVNGSLFLVLFLVTVSFRYFAGLGAAFCLALSAMSLLATAFMAIHINKRYIKVPSLTGL